MRAALTAKLLGLRPGEGRLVALACGLAFLVALSRVLFFSASNALFLGEFSANAYGWVYVAAAGVIAAGGAVYGRLKSRLPFSRLMVGSRSPPAWSCCGWSYGSGRTTTPRTRRGRAAPRDVAPPPGSATSSWWSCCPP